MFYSSLHIIISNNLHIIRKLEKKQKLNENDIDLICTNLMGYNNCLELMSFLLDDNYCNSKILDFIKTRGI